jgi:hypothetical protein
MWCGVLPPKSLVVIVVEFDAHKKENPSNKRATWVIR